jgi:hypothetical protein
VECAQPISLGWLAVTGHDSRSRRRPRESCVQGDFLQVKKRRRETATSQDQFQHIEEDYVYKDGDRQELYGLDNVESVQTILFRKRIDFGVGPLNVHACIDTSGPSTSVEVTLLGTTLVNL